MDHEKSVAGNNGRDNRLHETSSSTTSLDPNDPVSTKKAIPLNEEPQQFLGNDYHDVERQSFSNLSRVMSQPDNMKRLESLSRVLSTRRINVPGAAPGPLSVDPNDFDLNILLKSVAQRLDDQGMERKYTGFSFTDVTTSGIDIATAHGPSVPLFFLDLLTLPFQLLKKLHPKTRPIICRANALVREGELLLVLGRPGSGCTTFLKTVAGEIEDFTKVEGDISYAGATQHDMLKQFKSEVIYNPECKYFKISFSVNQSISQENSTKQNKQRTSLKKTIHNKKKKKNKQIT